MAVKRPLTQKQYEAKTAAIIASINAHTKPFEDDSEAAKKARRERGREDHEFFQKTYFPHYSTKPNGQIHVELDELLYLGGKSLCGVAFPREHGKSTHATFFAPIHMACYEISPYTIIISDTSELATEFVSWIKLEFEENPRLRQDFGDLVTYGMWEEGDIVIGGKCRIRGMGAREKIRGTRFMQHRPRLIVIDDLENDINVLNKKLVQRTFNWLKGAVYGSLDDDGVQLMVGTMLKRHSVLGLLRKHIEEEGPKFEQKYGHQRMFFKLYSAIQKDGTPCWPEGKSLQKLLEIKDIVGPLVWAAEFQNEPIDDAIFQFDWFKDYSHDRDLVILVRREWIHFTGSDPSARSSEIHDYKAHTVLARDNETYDLYVAEAWIRKCPIPVMNEAFRDIYIEYRPVACGYEINGYQEHIKDELEELLFSQGYYVNIVSITQHLDKIFRISRLVGPVRKSRVKFCKGHSDQDLLIEQFNGLGTSMEDDGPDSCEMAVHVSENWGGEIVKPARSARKRSFAAASRVMAGRQRIGAYRSEYLRSH